MAAGVRLVKLEIVFQEKRFLMRMIGGKPGIEQQIALQVDDEAGRGHQTLRVGLERVEIKVV